MQLFLPNVPFIGEERLRDEPKECLRRRLIESIGSSGGKNKLGRFLSPKQAKHNYI